MKCSCGVKFGGVGEFCKVCSVVRLTRPQRAVLRGLVNGWTNAIIAEDLGCTVETVRNHCWRLFEKIGAENRLQASVIGREHPEYWK